MTIPDKLHNAIQKHLQNNPKLLDPSYELFEFIGLMKAIGYKRAEFNLGRFRPDILFWSDNKSNIVVVEIKSHMLDKHTLDQIENYINVIKDIWLDTLKNLNKFFNYNVNGIVVAKIKDNTILEMAKNKYRLRVFEFKTSKNGDLQYIER